MTRDPLIVRVPTLLALMNTHAAVLAAIVAAGGRLVASFEIDAHGHTLGTRRAANRGYRCSSCGQNGHSVTRCNGEGQEPRARYRR